MTYDRIRDKNVKRFIITFVYGQDAKVKQEHDKDK